VATEKGVVIKTDAASAWVKTSRTAACEGCSARGTCHSNGSSDEMEVKVANDVGAKVGDRIVLSLETGPLLKASFLLYVFPVLLLILGAVIGQETAPYLNFNPSGFAAVAGFSFFAASLLIVKIKANQLAKKNEYRPRIIRIVN
jgi:sigma-E factor negative regulatory protein RseC